MECLLNIYIHVYCTLEVLSMTYHFYVNLHDNRVKVIYLYTYLHDIPNVIHIYEGFANNYCLSLIFTCDTKSVPMERLGVLCQ